MYQKNAINTVIFVSLETKEEKWLKFFWKELQFNFAASKSQFVIAVRGISVIHPKADGYKFLVGTSEIL